LEFEQESEFKTLNVSERSRSISSRSRSGVGVKNCRLRIPLLHFTPGAQPALHFGGRQISRTFIRCRHCAYSTMVQLFRKRSQICSFRSISENENLL